MGPIEHRQSPIEHREVRLHRVRWDAARASGRRAFLSDEERARLDGYGVEKRRREFLLGRVAARQLLSDVLGTAPAEVPLAVAEDGAVEVGGDGAWRVSISHTGEEAVAAVAERAVGVDLERIRERPERLHRFLLSEEERPLLERLPMPEADAFTLCWALKEAGLKALRCGLRRSPKTLRIAALDAEAGTARLDARERGRTFAASFERDGALWLVAAYETTDAS
jgi:4'-phosphopantetheinyl transferase